MLVSIKLIKIINKALFYLNFLILLLNYLNIYSKLIYK